MIFDKLTHIEHYLGCHPNLDTAIQFILSHDLSSLPLGRTEVAGSSVYINVMEASASPAQQLQYEIHRNYMDIQIDLSGVEIIQIGDSCGMQVINYDCAADFGTVICNDLTSCTIGPGNFIVCMAGEPHKPGIASSAQTALKKCVFKVYRPDQPQEL